MDHLIIYCKSYAYHFVDLRGNFVHSTMVLEIFSYLYIVCVFVDIDNSLFMAINAVYFVL